MKPFTRIKKIHGYEYAYEITPYYDKESKRIRQHSKYLGKYEDGKIKRVSYTLPVSAYDYGELLPFLKIGEDLKLNEILQTILPEDATHTVIALAINRIVSPVSLDNLKTWYDRTHLSNLYGSLSLSSQSISNLLRKLGESNINVDFSSRFVKSLKLEKKEALMYDITSLSSYSKLIDILEYGYNRDGLDLPQLNLFLIAHKTLGIPIFYDVYPGSIVDVSTLHNTIERLRSLGIVEISLIMDRGFFSDGNLADLKESGYDFIVPASFSNKRVKSMVLEMKKEIERGKNLTKFNGHVIFVMSTLVDIGEYTYQAYVYYDPQRESGERVRLYDRLHSIAERLGNRKLRKWENPSKVFGEIAGKYSSYLDWKTIDHEYTVNVKDKAVSQRVNRMGFTVILYRGEYDWKEVLTWYREKDIIEKMFMVMKKDLEIAPLRAHKTEVAKGLIFVNFIALIMRFRLLQLMKKTDLTEKYSIPKLILELSKIRRISLQDGSFITSEISKKQKDIIKKLELDV